MATSRMAADGGPLRLLLYALLCVLLAGRVSTVSGGGAEGRAPRITEHPVSVVVARHEPLTLRCHADGRPPPEVSWTKDGEPLTRGTRRPTPLPGGLFFLDVAQEDTGVYRCVATNAAGQALSKNATVEVAYLKHDFRAVPTPQVVTAGSTVLLQCGPPRGRPEPAVFWRKDGRTLNLDDGRQQRLRLVDGTNLAIRDAKTSDKGAYQCVAQNAHGTRESPPADVDVAVPPRILTRPTDTTALVGSTVVIRCEVTGDPIPDVLWRRGSGGGGNASSASSSMPLARVHVLPDGSLRMTGLRLSDSGEYVCDADNRAGAVSASAHLAVVSEPTLSPTPPKVLRLEPGSTATVRCGAKGVPQPLVMFSLRGNRTAMLPGQRLGRVAVSSDKATGVAVVSLEKVSHADSGRVLVCTAVNAAGATVARTRLVVLSPEQWPPPVIELGPSNQTLPPRAAVSMPCRTVTSGRPRAGTAIAWYKDGQLLPAPGPSANPSSTAGGSGGSRIYVAETGALHVQDLTEADAGEYSCLASSRSGRYRWRGWLRVAADGGAPQRAPDPATLPGAPSALRVNGTEHAAVLSWQRNTKVGSSTLLGYQVEVLARPAGVPDKSVMPTWTWSTVARLPPSTTAFTFEPADADAAYTFLVRAQNSHGLSPPSDLAGPVQRDEAGRWAWTQADDAAGGLGDEEDMADVQDALDLAPVVRLSEVVVASPTTVKVLWDVLDPDQVEGLSIYWRADTAADTEAAVGDPELVPLQSLTVHTQAGGPVEDGGGASSPASLGVGFLVTGLRCFTDYQFFLVPFNHQGEGRPSNSARVRTLPGPPSAPPTRLEASLINGSASLVKWSPPPTSFQNGPLQSYQVVVQAGDELVSNVTLSALAPDGAPQLLLSNLSHHSAYHVSVAAATAAGLGPFSAPITVRPAPPQHHRQEGGAGGELLTETWFMALLGSMVAVMVLLFSAIIFLHRRQHRANKETFLGFYDAGAGGPVLTTPLTLKASEGMPHPLSAPLSPPLCLVPQDTYGAKYRAVQVQGLHGLQGLQGVPQHRAGAIDDLMLPEYAEANDAQYDGNLSQGSTSSKSYYAEVRGPHMLSTFQSASGSAGSASGSHGSHRTDTASSRRGAGGEGGAGPYATTTLVCSARTASTAPCSSGSTGWSQENERVAYPHAHPHALAASYSDPETRPGVPCSPRSPAPPLQQQQQQHCLGHYDNYQYGSHASHPGSPSPLDHRDAALSLQLQPPRCASSSPAAGAGNAGTGTLGRENRRLKLLRRQLNRSAHANKGLPPAGPQSSQLQLLLRSSPSSSRSGSGGCSTPHDGSPPDDDDQDQVPDVHRPVHVAGSRRQEASDYNSSGGSSGSRRYGSGGSSSSSSGGGRSRAPVVAYSGLPRRDV